MFMLFHKNISVLSNLCHITILPEIILIFVIRYYKPQMGKLIRLYIIDFLTYFQLLLETMFEINFKINKQVRFGLAVYVIGNIPEFGFWTPSRSFRLDWNQGHVWQGKLTLKAETLKIIKNIQYKYIIADWINPTIQQLQWQHGQNNRVIDLIFTSNSLDICDQWNMKKLKIHLIVKKSIFDQNAVNYRYSIIGNCSQLGKWKIRKVLRLQQNINPKIVRKVSEKISKSDISKFLRNQLVFQVYCTCLTMPRDQNKFSYYFIRENQKLQVQRHPGRLYIQEEIKYPHRYAVINEGGYTGIYDAQNFDKPTLSKINSQIYLGSYLKNQNDLKHLKNLGIQAIYGIQTEQDHEDNGISPIYLELLCKQYGVIFKTIQIQQRNSRDFVKKSRKAVEQIDEMIKKGKTTYIYCSAGKYRSPQMVALYLTLKNGIDVAQAIKFIREKHPVAKPSQITIKTAIYHITKYNTLNPQNSLQISSFST